MPRDDYDPPPRVEHVHQQRGNFRSGFGLGLGCMCAIAFVVVGIPLLAFAGCATGIIGGAKIVKEEAEKQRLARERREAEKKVAADRAIAEEKGRKVLAEFASDRERETEADGLKVQLVGVSVGTAELLVDGKQTPSGADFLAVTIRLGAFKPDRTYEYRSWGLTNADAATLRDARGRESKPVTKPGEAVPIGHTPSGRVERDKPVTDVLLFWPPENDAGDLTLELPLLDKPGQILKLRIPASSWKKK